MAGFLDQYPHAAYIKTGSMNMELSLGYDRKYSKMNALGATSNRDKVQVQYFKVDFDSLNDAKIYAENTARKLAKEKAARAGAGQQVEIKIERSDQTASAAEGYGESNFLLASRVKAAAIGKPDVFSGSVSKHGEPSFQRNDVESALNVLPASDYP